MIKNYYVCIEWNEKCANKYAKENNKFPPEEFEIDVDIEEVNENNIHEMIDYLSDEVAKICDGFCDFRIDSYYEKKNN